MPAQKKTPKKGGNVSFKFDYVTSTVSLVVIAGQGDGIVVHVVNDSSATENTRVFIYHNTGAGAITVADTGPIAVVPTWQWGLGYTVTESGEYWVRVQTMSEILIPKVSFERVQKGVWTPVVSYKPGDFAVFQLTPSRKRLW
jgi:hypothetical protein